MRGHDHDGNLSAMPTLALDIISPRSLQRKQTANPASSALSNVVYLMIWRYLDYLLILLGCCCSCAVCELFKPSNTSHWMLPVPDVPKMSKNKSLSVCFNRLLLYSDFSNTFIIICRILKHLVEALCANAYCVLYVLHRKCLH